MKRVLCHARALRFASVTPLVIVLGLVAMISGLLIVTAYQATLPIIKEQKRLATQEAVLKVIPGASQVDGYVVEGPALAPATESNENGLHLYAGYDSEGTLKGLDSHASPRSAG